MWYLCTSFLASKTSSLVIQSFGSFSPSSSNNASVSLVQVWSGSSDSTPPSSFQIGGTTLQGETSPMVDWLAI